MKINPYKYFLCYIIAKICYIHNIMHNSTLQLYNNTRLYNLYTTLLIYTLHY